MIWSILDGDYYVSPTTGDDGNSGTTAYPFKTISFGLTAIGNTFKPDGITPKKLVIEGGCLHSDDIATISRSPVEFVWDGERGRVDPTAVNFRINKDGDIIRNLFVYDNTNKAIQMPDVNQSKIYLHNCIISNSLVYSEGWINTPYAMYFYDCIFVNCNIAWRYSPPQRYFGSGNIFYNITLSDSYGNATIDWYVYNSYFNAKPVFNPPENFRTQYLYAIKDTFRYNAIPSDFPTQHGTDVVTPNSGNHHILSDAVGFDAKFVDINNFNFNVITGSSLINAGSPNGLNGKPSNIGGVKIVDTFNSLSAAFTSGGGAVFTDIEVDTDDTFIITPPNTGGTLTSGIITLSDSKLISRVDLTKMLLYSNGIPDRTIDFEIAWGDSASELSTPVWSKMLQGVDMSFSDPVNRYGNADISYNPSLKQTIRAKYFMIKLTFTIS